MAENIKNSNRKKKNRRKNSLSEIEKGGLGNRKGKDKQRKDIGTMLSDRQDEKFNAARSSSYDPAAIVQNPERSKKKAEEYLTKWCADHDVTLGILRPSLLAGNNAPGNLGAMVDGIKSGKYLSINHGKARKSLLMAEKSRELSMPIRRRG